ncbi:MULTISPECIES: 1,2-phenylacetyl-CoA epoxidase subunit PaaD [Pontibacillus]|uniref:Phenylacetate-CoA oxygenase subunit PaaJ n=1 Tax=Pontibacillus chungwhensis TaxID=265426 RepID=A0ABY8UT55_9BACI|nr:MULTISPECIES: 1,2-phenylacetyl-CoA epoxidase subunit PaaD [Pontibacillus]MCD5323478.1 phenylacetate-CoA oxygenase subunit PaaJ [Pontibacillus sp. HN14]WIF96855.1 phenylacetate-CoA oxygenase subunit PaaJ [Pontibacillus chungwhensis]
MTLVLQSVEKSLENVKDPEIDSVSIIDLGMVEHVEVADHNAYVALLPTFMGCPALEIIEKNVREELLKVEGIQTVQVKFIYSPPWTSDRITEQGRERLKEFGIAPPPTQVETTGEWHVDCPYCGSTYTTMDNIFGPTACRSILYCKSCKNPFEAMKPVSTM